jgi:hypothetical protein
LALAQLGSRDALDDQEFTRRVVEMTIRVSVPSALRCAAKLNPKHSDALESAAVRCEREGTQDSARAAYAAAYAAAAAADAAAAAAAYAAAYAARDASLSDYAERVVRILIDMDAPGCQWLSLVPTEDK